MKDRRFTAYELCDSLFEFDVDRLRPAQEPDRRHPVAPLIEPAMRGSFDAWVIGEPEIIVRREHHDLAAADPHIATLFAFERDFVLEGLRFFDVLKLAIQCGVEFTRIHSVTP